MFGHIDVESLSSIFLLFPMEPVENLIQWFIAKGGSIDRSAIGFKEFPDSGRGAVALRDIDVRSALLLDLIFLILPDYIK